MSGIKKVDLWNSALVASPAAVSVFGQEAVAQVTAIQDLDVVAAVLDGRKEKDPVAFVTPSTNGSGEPVTLQMVEELIHAYKVGYGMAPSALSLVFRVPGGGVTSRKGLLYVTKTDKSGPFAAKWNEVSVVHGIGDDSTMEATYRRMESGVATEEVKVGRTGECPKLVADLMAQAFEAIIGYLSDSRDGKPGKTHVWWSSGRMTVGGMFCREEEKKSTVEGEAPTRVVRQYLIFVQRPRKGAAASAWLQPVRVLPGGLTFLKVQELTDANGGLAAARKYFEQFPGANETLNRCMESLLRLEKQDQERQHR
ncbi:MAG: hypothetical protein WCW26_02310 [Candidatus Buchananbacteria bacterium]